MPTITLDDINQAITEKYEPLTVDLGESGKVVLLSPLLLAKEQRKELLDAQKEFNALRSRAEAAGDEDEAAQESEVEAEKDEIDLEAEQVRVMQRMLSAVAQKGSPLGTLFGVLGDELVKYIELFSEYKAIAQPGEASASPS